MQQASWQIMVYVSRFCQGLRVTQAANFTALCYYALALLITCIPRCCLALVSYSPLASWSSWVLDG